MKKLKKQAKLENNKYMKLLFCTLEPDEWTSEYSGSFKRKTKHILPTQKEFDGSTIKMEKGEFTLKEVRDIYMMAGAVEVQMEYDRNGLTIWTYWPDTDFIIWKNEYVEGFPPYMCYSLELHRKDFIKGHKLFYRGNWYNAGNKIPGLTMVSSNKPGFVIYIK